MLRNLWSKYSPLLAGLVTVLLILILDLFLVHLTYAQGPMLPSTSSLSNSHTAPVTLGDLGSDGSLDTFIANSRFLDTKPNEDWLNQASVAPGGVSSGLGLWLKADAEVYSDAGITLATNGDNALQWHDQSDSSNIATEAQIASTSNITYVTEAVNFNPAVQFDGTSSQNLKGGSANPFPYPATVIVVAKADRANEIDGLFTGGGFIEQSAPGIYLDVNGQYVVDAAGANATISANTPSALGQYHIIDGQYTQGSSQNSSIFMDGALTEFYTGAGVSINNTFSNFEVGGRTYDGYNNRIFDGNIAEVIFYSTILTDTQRNKVESYLAIKYGITMTGTQGISYTASDGTVIWNATTNTAYHHDVAGIGVDTNSGMSQLKSRSINSNTLVTIESSGTNVSSGEFLLWGNDAGSTGVDASNKPAGITTRIGRQWKAAETGDVGAVTVTMDISSLADVQSLLALPGYRVALLIDNDGDGNFTTGSITVKYADSLASNIATFNNVDLNNGAVFTLGIGRSIYLPIVFMNFTP